MNQVIDVWADLSNGGWLDLAVLLGFVLYFGIGIMMTDCGSSRKHLKKRRKRKTWKNKKSM